MFPPDDGTNLSIRVQQAFQTPCTACRCWEKLKVGIYRRVVRRIQGFSTVAAPAGKLTPLRKRRLSNKLRYIIQCYFRFNSNNVIFMSVIGYWSYYKFRVDFVFMLC